MAVAELARADKSAARGNVWWNAFPIVPTKPVEITVVVVFAGIVKTRGLVLRGAVSTGVFPTAMVKSAEEMAAVAHAPYLENRK